LRPSDFSDIGQAKVLTREYGNELCYTDATDYLRFNGEYWMESRQQSVGAMEEFLDLQLQDALGEVESALNALVALGEKEEDILAGGKKYEASLSGDPLKALKKYQSAIAYRTFVMKRRDMKYVISALQAAKPMLEIKVSDLDKDEFLLNTPGVTFDLRKGLAGGRAPDAADYITKQTTASPGDKGEQIWLDALNTFFCNDQKLIDYVQQIVGLSAIGKVYLEAIIIAYGGGRNGKSTFWNSISRVLGSYSGAISADTLTVGCRRNVKPEMAELKGKRLIIASELEEGMRLNTSIVKQLSSTDEIEAEKKYKDPFKFEPSHTLVLYTNHLPRVGANDDGTWRRLIVIPFNARIENKSDIKNYADYLVKNAGSYIMSWIIEGAKKAIEANYHFSVPACVQEAIEAYRENNDWLASFLEDCCEVDKTYQQKSGEFYQEYRAHCGRNGEYTRSTTDFYTALETAGFERKKTKTGSFIYGVRLKEEEFLS
jgi:P4 family phage/plasmid primase-like protien